MRASVLSISLVFLWAWLAPSSTRADELRLGVGLAYSEELAGFELGREDIVEHYDMLGARGLVDLHFVRAALGLSQSIGQFIRFSDTGEEKLSGYRIRTVNLSVVGKYPWHFLDGKLDLWPAAGLRGTYALDFSRAGQRANAEPHDLLVGAGGGGDLRVSDRVALTLQLLVGVNLTPGVGGGTRSPSGLAGDLVAGILWKLW